MAYAAALSLLQTLSQLQLSVEKFSNIPKSQIEILHQKVSSLKDFLKNNRENIDDGFEIQIRDAIYKAEDNIDFHISSSTQEAEISSQNLERIIDEINSIAEQTKEKLARQDLDRHISTVEGWRSSSTHDHDMFGRHKDYIPLTDTLISGSDKLEVVPIVGDTGIGKTTLAKYVYKGRFIEKNFPIRGWVRVSVRYHKREVLLDLLGSMEKRGDGVRQKTDDQLVKYLNFLLKSKRYLIVLDDVRDVAAWNDFKEFFPDHFNGSRVVITTREKGVADTASGTIRPHELGFLNDAETWALLGEIVFGTNQSCPLEVEEIAKEIAKNCRGLPLAIVTVGRLLSWVNDTDWGVIASSINTCAGNDNLIQVILSLTYKWLPQHLKPCLLYLGLFPYNDEIPVSKLVKLWIAEGFIEPRRSKTPEEVAQIYLEDLFRRSLISVKESEHMDGTNTCRIDEEVFHYFVMEKAKAEKFFLVINKDTDYGSVQEDTIDNPQRRLCIHKNIVPFVIEDMPENELNTSISNARTLLYFGPEYQYPLRPWMDFKLLKILNALKIRFYNFPDEVLKLAQLKYLALSCNGEVPVDVCKLRNLEILIVSRYLRVRRSRSPSNLPVEIWNMKELRHLQVMGSDLPHEFPSDSTDLDLEKLSTLSDVGARSCTQQILQRIKNLKKLGIRVESLLEDESLSFFSHLHILRRLESFKCIVMHPDIRSQVVSSLVPAFPSRIRKLTLSGCGFSWENVSVIAALPYLKVLKLLNYAFHGPKWEVKEDDFPRLNLLLLEDMDLKNWILAHKFCFVRLKYLFIKHCYGLQEIPSAFRSILGLEMIEVVDCCKPLIDSAIKIKENHYGNKDIQVDIYSSRDD